MTTQIHSDDEIQEDVIAELAFEARVRPTDIGVRVQDGIVTLFGSVSSYAAREAAQEAALRVRGVRAVANDVDVSLADSDQRTDEDIARAAALALQWDVHVPEERIQISVRGGHVTLAGDVAAHYAREAAEADIRRLRGVRSVANQIHIVAPDAAHNVEQEIRAALIRSAATDADQIHATVYGHTVTLRGTVRSWIEQQDALRVAFSMPGITDVNNELLIVPAR